jgi:hypothetical protein
MKNSKFFDKIKDPGSESAFRIRIRIKKSNFIRIYADPDPKHLLGHKNMLNVSWPGIWVPITPGGEEAAVPG